MTQERQTFEHEEVSNVSLLPPSAGLDLESYEPYDSDRFENVRRGARRVLDVITLKGVRTKQAQEKQKPNELGPFKTDSDGVIWENISWGDETALCRRDGLHVVMKDGTYKTYWRDRSLAPFITTTQLDGSVFGSTDKNAIASYLDAHVPVPNGFVRKEFTKGSSLSLRPLDSGSGKLETLVLGQSDDGNNKVAGLGFRKGMIDKWLKDEYRELVITKRANTFDVSYKASGRTISEFLGATNLPIIVTELLKRLPTDVQTSIRNYLEIAE